MSSRPLMWFAYYDPGLLLKVPRSSGPQPPLRRQRAHAVAAWPARGMARRQATVRSAGADRSGPWRRELEKQAGIGRTNSVRSAVSKSEPGLAADRALNRSARDPSRNRRCPGGPWLIFVRSDRFHQGHQLPLNGLVLDLAVGPQQPEAERAVEKQQAFDLARLAVAVVEKRDGDIERS